MGKLRSVAVARTGGVFAALVALTPVAAAPLGPNAAACQAGSDRPAALVRVVGFKARTGSLRVQAYAGDPAHYFDKGTYLKRIDVQVPVNGLVEVCMPLPKPGVYAISVRHDADGTGKTSLSDGGGMSGNPTLSLFDVMMKHKPAPNQVEVKVGNGIVPVPVVLNYIHGLSFGPVTTATR